MAQTDKNLQRDLATAWRIVAWLEEGGYELSARLFRHYLEASGEPVTIPLERLRESSVFCDAEQKIMERVAKQILADTIDMLQCGDTFRQVTRIADDGDHRKTDDVAFESFETWKDVWTLTPRKVDVDTYGALGEANIRAIPEFRIWRSGRELQVDGLVHLVAWDIYDFNPRTWRLEDRDMPSLILGFLVSDSVAASWFSLKRLQELALHGHAAPFQVRTEWVKGVSPLPPYTNLLLDIRSAVVRALADYSACGNMDKPRLRIELESAFDWSEQSP